MAEELVKSVDGIVEADLPAEKRAPLDLERANLLARAPKEVKTPEEFTAADTWRGEWAAFAKRAWTPWEEWTNTLFRRHKHACDQRTLFFKEGGDRDKLLHAEMDAFRRREEAERRKKELEETERQQRELEANRKREAKVLKQAGHVEQAKAVMETPIPAAPVNLPSRVPTPVFTRFRKVWKWRPAFSQEKDGEQARKDEKARKQSAKLVPRDSGFLDLDDKALNDFAKRNKDTIKVPGIKFYEDTER